MPLALSLSYRKALAMLFPFLGLYPAYLAGKPFAPLFNHPDPLLGLFLGFITLVNGGIAIALLRNLCVWRTGRWHHIFGSDEPATPRIANQYAIFVFLTLVPTFAFGMSGYVQFIQMFSPFLLLTATAAAVAAYRGHPAL